VAINAGDVDVLVAEFEVDKKAAERRLRESGGSLYDALKSYL
jgi:NACalpha-BTF3-like transcription factor